MTIFYSKTTNGFYHSEINKSMPNDAIAISDEVHTNLMTDQESGKVITSDSAGNPISVTRTPSQQSIILSQINALEATQTLRRMRDSSPEGQAWLTALEGKIAALRAQLAG